MAYAAMLLPLKLSAWLLIQRLYRQAGGLREPSRAVKAPCMPPRKFNAPKEQRNPASEPSIGVPGRSGEPHKRFAQLEGQPIELPESLAQSVSLTLEPPECLTEQE